MIERWRQQPAAGQDLVLALVLGAAWFGLATYWEASGWRPRHDDIWDLAGAASVVAVAIRRSVPAGLLVVAVLVYPVLYDVPLLSEFHLLPVFVVAYAAGRRSPIGTAAVALASLGAGVLLSTGLLHFDGLVPRRLDWSGILFHGFAVAGMVLLGIVTATLASRNAELERLRAVEAEQAVGLERTRIARELHDDVAHHLTALIVRAQAADRVAPERPDVAVESMGWIAETAREALTAMRRTVAVLRDADGRALRSPGSTLADLPAIVDGVRHAGLVVSFDVESELPPLEAQVQHAVVRVVQEALTNVLRHAGAHRATVSLTASAHGVSVVVEDDGGGPGPDGVTAGGLGLPGMHERAESCGGRLDIDRGALGGWRVRAWFPAAVRSAVP